MGGWGENVTVFWGLPARGEAVIGIGICEDAWMRTGVGGGGDGGAKRAKRARGEGGIWICGGGSCGGRWWDLDGEGEGRLVGL